METKLQLENSKCTLDDKIKNNHEISQKDAMYFAYISIL